MNPVAPSDEMTLHCDAHDCAASVSMVPGVSREEHGWGRMSIYGKAPLAFADYDLCPEHLQRTLEVVGALDG